MSLEKPAVGENFYDREEELKLLLDLVGKNEHFILYGLRKVGKTSLLLRLSKELSKKFIFYYYYVPETRSFDVLFEDMRKNFFLTLLGESKPLTDEELLPKVLELYPAISSRLIALWNLKRTTPSFKDLFLYMDDISESLGRKLVVVLDEFQNLIGVDRALIDYLRQVIWKAENTVFILSGSSISVIHEIIHSPSSIQGIRSIKLKPFDYKTSREFLISITRKSVGEIVMAFLYYLTGGMPFHLKVIAKSINSLHVEKITFKALSRAIEMELFDDTGILFNYYASLETKLRNKTPLYLEILYAISQGKKRLNEIARFIGKKPHDINYLVKQLRVMDILDEDNNIIDSMLKIWLQTTWYVINKTPALQVRDMYTILREKIEEIIETYKSYAGQALEIIVKELFHRFDNRKISTGETLPKFETVIPNYKVGEKEIDLLCLKKKKTWVIEVKTKPLRKKDVEEFIEKTKNIDFEIEKMIIIATNTVSKEALEAANKNNVDIWGREKLKLLMKIFDIPITPQLL